MSEQQAEQTSDGSVGAAPGVPHQAGAHSEITDAAVPTVEMSDSPKIAPDHEAPATDAPKHGVPDVGGVRPEPPSLGSLGAKGPRFEPTRATYRPDMNRTPPQLVLMPRRDDYAKDEQPETAPKAPYATLGKRGVSVAAMLALALIGGAVGGALATAGLIQTSAAPAPVMAAAAPAPAPVDPALTASIAKLHTDVDKLRASLEQAKQASRGELVKTADRVDKLEKDQADLTAKVNRPSEVAKLSEVVEKLRAQAAASNGAREVTGSITPPAAQPAQPVAAAAPPAPQAAPVRVADAGRPDAGKPQPKIVDSWALRDVGRGGALIEGRQGLFQVFVGDPVPGLGKVEAIRRQDGRWVVVTTNGLVVSR